MYVWSTCNSFTRSWAARPDAVPVDETETWRNQFMSCTSAVSLLALSSLRWALIIASIFWSRALSRAASSPAVFLKHPQHRNDGNYNYGYYSNTRIFFTCFVRFSLLELMTLLFVHYILTCLLINCVIMLSQNGSLWITWRGRSRKVPTRLAMYRNHPPNSRLRVTVGRRAERMINLT